MSGHQWRVNVDPDERAVECRSIELFILRQIVFSYMIPMVATEGPKRRYEVDAYVRPILLNRLIVIATR